MTKAPENAPALLFLGTTKKNGGADGVTTNDMNFMGGGWGASIVAHFARKVRATVTSREDLRSLWVRYNLRPPHFASKVSYSASPQ